MISLLVKRFPQVKEMQPKGRSNAVSAFLQTKPPFIVRMHGKFYRWAGVYDGVIAARELSELITINLGLLLPSPEDLAEVM